MARGYPRFLYSDPQNVSTPGPFIVHTLEPRFIAKISKHSLEPDPDGFQVFSNRKYNFKILDGYIDADDRQVIDRAFTWFEKQLNSGEIKLHF